MVRFAAVVLALLALFGCRDDVPDWSDWPIKTADGLSFSVPPGWEAIEGAAGVSLRQKGDLRSVPTIRFHAGTGVPDHIPAEATPIQHGDDPWAFVIMELGAGSGGMEYGLLTSKQLGGRWVTLFASQQSELSVPDFGSAWAVWDSLALADQAASDVSTSRAQ